MNIVKLVALAHLLYTPDQLLLGPAQSEWVYFPIV